MNVLLIEDQSNEAEKLKCQLAQVWSQYKCQFIHTKDCLEAVEMLSSLRATELSLVIINIKVDKEESLDLLIYLAMSRFKNTPIALISSSDIYTAELLADIAQSYELTCIGVYQKPLHLKKLATQLLKHQKKATLLARHAQDKIGGSTATFCDKRNIWEYLNEDNLVLYYQPRSEIQSAQIMGFEVLSRLATKQGELIYPQEYLPITSSLGLSNHLTRLIINQAIKMWNMFPELKQYSLSIKICAEDFKSRSFVKFLLNTCSANQDIKIYLELIDFQGELNCNQLFEDLAMLLSHEIAISVGCFDNNYNDYARYKQPSFSEIKKDKTFSLELDSNAKNLWSTQTLIALAKKLKVHVLDEGVETYSVFTKLKRIGCHKALGYFLGRPIGGQSLVRWLNDYQQRQRGYHVS